VEYKVWIYAGLVLGDVGIEVLENEDEAGLNGEKAVKALYTVT